MATQRKTKRRAATEERAQEWPASADELAPGLAWCKIYWVIGSMPANARLRNEVRDPPNAGWSSVLVLPAGGDRVRLFCPYTFQGYTVSSKSLEFDSLEVPRSRLKRTWMRELLYEHWKQFDSYGWQKDYDTAARVMREMKWEVPMRAAPEVDFSSPDTKRRGKEAGPELLKPVPKEGRRGKVLSWFMDSLDARSIREAMAEFDTTRSNVLTVLFQLNKDHGIGYRLSGDAAEIVLPAKGCDKLYG